MTSIRSRSGAYLLRVWPLADALLIAGVFAAVWDRGIPAGGSGLFAMTLVAPLWVFLLDFFGLYESQRVESIPAIVRKTVSAHVVGFCVVAAAVYLVLPGEFVGAIGSVFLLGTVLLVTERSVVYGGLHLLRRRGFDHRNVCVIGDRRAADQQAERFREHAAWGFQVTCVGSGAPESRRFVSYPDGREVGDNLEAVLATQVVDEVVIAVPPEEAARERATVRTCNECGVIARLLIEVHAGAEPVRLQEFCGQPVMELGGVRHDESRMLVKRLVDVVGSVALLVLLSPLLLVIALVVKLSSPGPIIFRQRRTGLHGRQFTLYKFRTMIDHAETLLQSVSHRSTMGGPIFKDPADLRITRVGRLLRKFSLDELPQLLNVLAGDMSLVGPRPLPLHEAALITGEHRRRFHMRPGITCLWQVNGRSNVTYDTWMRYDLQYVDGWSLSLDAKLLVKTIPAVFTGRGAC